MLEGEIKKIIKKRWPKPTEIDLTNLWFGL